VRGDARGYDSDEIVLVGERKYMQQTLSDESQISQLDGASRSGAREGRNVGGGVDGGIGVRDDQVAIMQRTDKWRPYVEVECDARRSLGDIEVFPALLPETQSLEAFGECVSCVQWVVHPSPASFFEILHQNGALDHTIEMTAGCLTRDYIFDIKIRDYLNEELWR
jgi:hypothetical protein